MSKVILKVNKSYGTPMVSLSVDKKRIGSVFGTLKFPSNEFDRECDRFAIRKGDDTVAIIWNVSLAEEEPRYGTYRIKAGE